MAQISPFTADEKKFLGTGYKDSVLDNYQKILRYIDQNIGSSDKNVARILENLIRSSVRAFNSESLQDFTRLANVYLHKLSLKDAKEETWCLFQTKLNREISRELKDTEFARELKDTEFTREEIKAFVKEMVSLVKPIQDILYTDLCLRIRKTSLLLPQDLADFENFKQYVDSIQISSGQTKSVPDGEDSDEDSGNGDNVSGNGGSGGNGSDDSDKDDDLGPSPAYAGDFEEF